MNSAGSHSGRWIIFPPSSFILHPFGELDQHAVTRRGMQERGPAAVRPRHRRFVDEPVALRLQGLEVFFDVVDSEADVMNALAALLDELRDRGVGAGWLEELQVRVADGEEGRLYLLRLDGLDVLDAQSQRLVDACRIERFHGDSDVIELGHSPES